MRIIVTVQDFQCVDAGLYKCRVTLPDASQYNSIALNITAKGNNLCDCWPSLVIALYCR